MSIKRTRQRTYSPRQRDDGSELTSAEPAEPERSWDDLVAGQADDVFQPFSLKTRYAKGTFLAHPTFGKGVVVSSGETVIEVMFRDSKKKLRHGMS